MQWLCLVSKLCVVFSRVQITIALGAMLSFLVTLFEQHQHLKKSGTNFVLRYKAILSKERCFKFKDGEKTIPEVKTIFENLDEKKYMRLACEAYLLRTFFSKSEQQKKYIINNKECIIDELTNRLLSGAEIPKKIKY